MTLALTTPENTDVLTQLTSAGGRRLAKYWQSSTEKPQAYEEVKQVRVTEHLVRGIRELDELLIELERDPASCLIRGRFIGEHAAQRLYNEEIERDRRLGKALLRPKEGYTLRRNAFFTDQALHYCLLDIDGFRPEGVDPVRQPVEACEQFVAKCLPSAFQGVTFRWQLSGSAGHPSAAGVLKAHLVFWLKTPYSSLEMEAWAKQLASVDHTVFRRIQIHYTASPVFAPGVADPVPVRSGLVEGWNSDEVDLVIDQHVIEHARTVRKARADMVDPRDKDNLIGTFCRTFEMEIVVERWLPHVFEFVTENRLNFLHGGGAPEGAAVTENRQGIFNTHATDPLGGRATNKWDLVRYYLFGHLDEGLTQDERLLLGPGGWPSHVAMKDMVLRLPEIQRALQEEENAERSQSQKLLADFKQAIADCDNAELLQTLAGGIAKIEGINDVAREQLAKQIQNRAKEHGTSLPIATIREWLKSRHSSSVQASESIPDWARDWVYVTSTDRFLNIRTKEEVTSKGFQARYNRLMPQINSAGDRAPADKVALDQWCIPTVSHLAYLPTAGTFFEMYGRQWVNTFQPHSAPAIPAELSPEQLQAIHLIEQHLEEFFENERDRRLFISWIAHNVQYPGRKIRWSPLVVGGEGDGKSLWFSLLGSVLGAVNVKSLSARVLESSFTDWVVGAAVIAIEEVKLHGHNRYDVLNAIKPVITNDEISVHPKGKAPYTAPNTTNYLLFSNHLDAAPVSEGDRRLMVLSSRISLAQATKMTEDGYYKRLFGALRDHPGALRKWLLELPLDPDFDPDGRAPMTDAKREAIELSLDDMTRDIRDLIHDQVDGVTPEVVSVTDLTSALQGLGHEKISGRRVAQELERSGFRFVDRRRHEGQRLRIYVRRDLNWGFEQAVAHLQARRSPDFLQ